jgi:hypothetical protein
VASPLFTSFFLRRWWAQKYHVLAYGSIVRHCGEEGGETIKGLLPPLRCRIATDKKPKTNQSGRSSGFIRFPTREKRFQRNEEQRSSIYCKSSVRNPLPMLQSGGVHYVDDRFALLFKLCIYGYLQFEWFMERDTTNSQTFQHALTTSSCCKVQSCIYGTQSDQHQEHISTTNFLGVRSSFVRP